MRLCGSGIPCLCCAACSAAERRASYEQHTACGIGLGSMGSCHACVCGCVRKGTSPPPRQRARGAAYVEGADAARPVQRLLLHAMPVVPPPAPQAHICMHAFSNRIRVAPHSQRTASTACGGQRHVAVWATGVQARRPRLQLISSSTSPPRRPPYTRGAHPLMAAPRPDARMHARRRDACVR